MSTTADTPPAGYLPHYQVGAPLGFSYQQSHIRAKDCPGVVKQRAGTKGRAILEQLLVPDTEETRRHFLARRVGGRPRSTEGGSTLTKVERLARRLSQLSSTEQQALLQAITPAPVPAAAVEQQGWPADL